MRTFFMNDNIDPCPNQPVDALDRLAAESATPTATTLSVARLDQNELLVIPFTAATWRCDLHWVKAPAVKGFVHCGGGDCLLCRVGEHATTYELLPVFDPVEELVVVLPYTLNLRPQALRPQLLPILTRVKAGDRLLVAIRKSGQFIFAVSDSSLPKDANDGASQIAAFLDLVNSNAVDPGSVYLRLSAKDLAAVPEIARKMTLKGITRE
jgi:hypothetical protein